MQLFFVFETKSVRKIRLICNVHSGQIVKKKYYVVVKCRKLHILKIQKSQKRMYGTIYAQFKRYNCDLPVGFQLVSM